MLIIACCIFIPAAYFFYFLLKPPHNQTSQPVEVTPIQENLLQSYRNGA